MSTPNSNYNSLALTHTLQLYATQQQTWELRKIARNQETALGELANRVDSVSQGLFELRDQVKELGLLISQPRLSGSTELERRAENALAEGWVDMALDDYLLARDLNPYSLRANFFSSIIYFSSGNLSEARKGYEATLRFACSSHFSKDDIEDVAARIWFAAESVRSIFEIGKRLDNSNLERELDDNYQILSSWIDRASGTKVVGLLPQTFEQLEIRKLIASQDHAVSDDRWAINAVRSVWHLELCNAFCKRALTSAAVISLLAPDIAASFSTESPLHRAFLEKARDDFKRRSLEAAMVEISEALPPFLSESTPIRPSSDRTDLDAAYFELIQMRQKVATVLDAAIEKEFEFDAPPKVQNEIRFIPATVGVLSTVLLLGLTLIFFPPGWVKTCTAVLLPERASGGELSCSLTSSGFSAVVVLFGILIVLVPLLVSQVKQLRQSQVEFQLKSERHIAARKLEQSEFTQRKEAAMYARRTVRQIWNRQLNQFSETGNLGH